MVKIKKNNQRLKSLSEFALILIFTVFFLLELNIIQIYGDTNNNSQIKGSGAQVEFDIIWNNAYGGPGIEYTESIIRTSDSGYALLGRTNSTPSGDYDLFILKTDNNGNQLWNLTLGNPYDDFGYQIVECPNSDLVILGDQQYNSNDWAYDIYLARIDNTGTILRWNYTFGSSNSQELGRSLFLTNNSHFLIGGVYPISGLESELWLIRTNSFGAHLWNKTYGGNETDRIFQNNLVLECDNEDIVMGGYTISFGSGQSDVWLIKTDSFGNIIWNKTYGGSELDRPQMISECEDGGFIVCANTNSYGQGDLDLWVIKTDSLGNLIWNITFGGETCDEGRSIIEMDDGGFLISGSTTKFGSGNGGLWLVKVDQSGDLLWETGFGESQGELCKSMCLENQTCLVFTGKTEKNGNEDVWLIKINLNLIESGENGIPGYCLLGFSLILAILFITPKVKKLTHFKD
ncbi:MAG: hypothetical protein EU543_03255 [Promethearchaeota archaeon]|nr:MAG: hypothetical protein EU543_03255 [Candidatus Lokiarchaeota archaeon]